MPERDGVWLLEQIRALLATPRVPVVALTGRVMPAPMQQGSERRGSTLS